jgi:TonB family protein
MSNIIRSSLLTGFLAAAFLVYIEAQDQPPVVDDSDISIIEFEELVYPPVARLGGLEGTVVVRVSLDGNGNVLSATAISGHGLFVGRCLENIKRWRFQPNSHNAAVVVYDFRIGGRCSSNASATSHFSLYRRNLAKITGCLPVVQ